MDFPTKVKLAVYHHFAETGRGPTPAETAERVDSTPNEILATYRDLRAKRVLLVDRDGVSIRMAPPFSGVPTQHRVHVDGIDYFANCAWDAFGIPAALHKPGVVDSRCEQTMEPLHLQVAVDGPARSSWVFHSLVRASKWWDDLIFT